VYFTLDRWGLHGMKGAVVIPLCLLLHCVVLHHGMVARLLVMLESERTALVFGPKMNCRHRVSVPQLLNLFSSTRRSHLVDHRLCSPLHVLCMMFNHALS